MGCRFPYEPVIGLPLARGRSGMSVPTPTPHLAQKTVTVIAVLAAVTAVVIAATSPPGRPVYTGVPLRPTLLSWICPKGQVLDGELTTNRKGRVFVQAVWIGHLA